MKPRTEADLKRVMIEEWIDTYHTEEDYINEIRECNGYYADLWIPEIWELLNNYAKRIFKDLESKEFVNGHYKGNDCICPSCKEFKKLKKKYITRETRKR